jgi:glycosyltransferase involved in cell wall biosynthesis
MMLAMRLLFAESSTRGYGTEQHIAALATAMARRGHDVRSLVIAGSPVERILHEAGMATVSVRPGRARGPRIVAALLTTAWRQHSEWLVSNDSRFYGMFVGLQRFGARAVIFRHWHDAPRSERTRQLLSRHTDRFVLVSKFQRTDYGRQGMDVERASILYNPVDTARFQPSEASRRRTRSRFQIDESEIVVGYVGRMIEAKGIFTLFDASERVLAEDGAQAPRGVRMLWVGDGEDSAELRLRVSRSEHRGRHVFSEWEPDTAAIYSALDILAVPSIYPDPSPRVSVEAQAAGIPVVCSAAGGLPETLIPGVTGHMIEAGDSVGLSRAIQALVRDPARRQEMGAAGRAWACSRFSLQRIAEDFEVLLADG